jgi:hypothetical protein
LTGFKRYRPQGPWCQLVDAVDRVVGDPFEQDAQVGLLCFGVEKGL